MYLSLFSIHTHTYTDIHAQFQMNPFYLSLNAIIDQSLASVSTTQPECSTMFNKDGNSYETDLSAKKWSKVLQKIPGDVFTKQVAFIIVFYFSTTIQHTPELSKFELLKQMNLNRLLTEPIREEIRTMFQRAQRCYRALTRLARIFRLRKTPVQMTADLYMTELVPSNRNTFVLLDNDRVYYFALKDLVRIITEALTFSYSFFSEPNICKNPYNNLPFTKATLYNIYFQMKSTFCVVPKFIQLFFEVNFNIYEFKKRNEWTIRQHKIREYISRTDPAKLIPDVLRMFLKYDTGNKINIHSEMPCDVLMRKVKPLYHLYLLRKYCVCHMQSDYYEHELIYKMKEFIRLNPMFGRKIHVARSPFKWNLQSLPPVASLSFLPKVPLVKNLSLLLPASNFHTDVIAQPEDEFTETHQYNDATYNRFIQYGILSDPIIDSSDEEPAIFVNWYENAGEDADEDSESDTEIDDTGRQDTGRQDTESDDSDSDADE